MAPDTILFMSAAVCAISPADVESSLKDFRAGLPMNLLQKTSESLFCRRPVMRRVLTCQTWNELDGKDQGGQSHISLFLAGGVSSGGMSCLGTGMSDLPAVLQPQW